MLDKRSKKTNDTCRTIPLISFLRWTHTKHWPGLQTLKCVLTQCTRAHSNLAWDDTGCAGVGCQRDGEPAREHRCQSLVFFIKAWKKIDKMLRAIHLSGDNTRTYIVCSFCTYFPGQFKNQKIDIFFFFLRKGGGWFWSGSVHFMQLNEHLFLTDTFGSGGGCSGAPSKSCFSRDLGEIDGASGNSSPHTKMQFKIITASAPVDASLPTWCRGGGRRGQWAGSAAWGRQAGTPAPGAPRPPPEPEGGAPQDPWTLPRPTPELTPHPEQSKGVRKGPKESRGTKAGEQPWKETKPHPLGLCPPHISGCMLHFKKLCSPGQRLRASWLSTHPRQAQRRGT